MDTTTYPECSEEECHQIATRQTYAAEQQADPWDARNFVLWCDDHDPGEGRSWPAIASEGIQ